MKKFTRTLNDQCIARLQQTDLFQDKLKEDIKRGTVFPTIRGGSIEFYYKGSLMFKYSNEFETHYKFLINNDRSQKQKNDYIKNDGKTPIDRDDLIITNFLEGYKSIQKSIDKYAKPEAILTSDCYKHFSFFKEDPKSKFFLIDIEAAFTSSQENSNSSSDNPKNTTDRIDVVLFDTANQQIIFCEVKRFDDSRIYPKIDKDAEVIGQLSRYQQQIAKRKEEIIQAYNHAFEIYGKLFGTEAYKVKDVYPQAILFVTGFTESQNDNTLKSAIDRIEKATNETVFSSQKVTKTTFQDICKYCRGQK
jgi:hypothetical protein